MARHLKWIDLHSFCVELTAEQSITGPCSLPVTQSSQDSADGRSVAGGRPAEAGFEAELFLCHFRPLPLPFESGEEVISKSPSSSANSCSEKPLPGS